MNRKPTPSVLDAVLSADVAPDRAMLRSRLRYDYAAVPMVHRKAVEDAAIDILANGQRMKESAVVIGERLLDVKQRLDHGQFSDWCSVEFDMSQRTAQNMMNVARQFGGKNETVSLLSDSVLYLLAAPSTPESARETVIDLAKSGEKVTKTQAQAVIDEYRDRRVAADDPWAAAWNSDRPYEERVELVARAILPWVTAWTDDKGRTWQDVVDRNPQHANSPFRQDLEAEWRRRKAPPISGAVLVRIIRCAFELLGQEGEAAADEADISEQLFRCISHSATLSTEQQRTVLRELMLGRGESYHQMLAPWIDLDAIEAGELRDAARQAYMRLLAEDAPLTAEDVAVLQPAPAPDNALPAHLRYPLLTPADRPLASPEYIAAYNAQVLGETRQDRLSVYAGLFRQCLDAMRTWAELTGRHTLTCEAERGLRKMLAATEREIALLNGQPVEDYEMAA